VMKAREIAGDGADRLYFGYGTILDRAAFEEWRGEHGYEFFELPAGELAEAVDVGLTFDFPSRWWGGRVAGLEDRQGERVFGRLYRILSQDWPIVQHKEGAVTGMCVERSVRVRVGGRELDATAFATNPRRRSLDGPVSQRFVDSLIRGAESAGLPADYLASLRRLA
jgi:gamma-glutamylcyclotransferase